jgi:hypothetical protein
VAYESRRFRLMTSPNPRPTHVIFFGLFT